MVPAYLQTTFQNRILLAQKRAAHLETISTHHTSNHQYFKTTNHREPSLHLSTVFNRPRCKIDIYIYMHVSEEKKNMNHYRKTRPRETWIHMPKKLTHTRKFPHGFFFSHPSPLAYLFVYHHHSGKKLNLLRSCGGSHCPIGFHPTSPKHLPSAYGKDVDHPFHISHPPLPMPPSLLPLRPFAVSASSWL